MRTIRYFAWGLLALAVIGISIFLITAPADGERSVTTSRVDPDATFQIGGPFTAIGSDGERFSSIDLAGRPYALFFGFTHCPDICPTTLSDLVRLREQLGGEEAFEIVFVTVDPERDGVEQVGRYTDLFETEIIGLTGRPDQIEAIKKNFGVRSIKRGEGDDYQVDHTANVFLMDASGEFIGTISPEEGRDIARQKLERIAA